MTEAWVLVLAGGEGSRLWPLSRRARPKYLVDMGSGQSLLELTLIRAREIAPVERTIVISDLQARREVAEIAERSGVNQLIFEPMPMGTSAALALGISVIARHSPDFVVAAISADLHISGSDGFCSTIEQAALAATEGYLTVVGVRPDRPEVGYGYIRAGDTIRPGVRLVESFHEKPGFETAVSYVESGEYFWDSGILVTSAASFLNGLRRYCPELAAAAGGIADHLEEHGTIDRSGWASLPRAPIEYALLEPAGVDRKMALVPAEFEWQDVGTWYGVTSVTQNHPAGTGRVLLHSSQDCYVHLGTEAAGRRYALVGLRNVVVVDAGDVVLILDRDSSQDVRGLVERLDEAGWADLR